MISPEIRSALNDLPSTHYGKALKLFLDDKLKELQDVRDCKSWEETLGRQYAVKIVDELFSFMREQKNTEKSKNQYE